MAFTVLQGLGQSVETGHSWTHRGTPVGPESGPLLEQPVVGIWGYFYFRPQIDSVHLFRSKEKDYTGIGLFLKLDISGSTMAGLSWTSREYVGNP